MQILLAAKLFGWSSRLRAGERAGGSAGPRPGERRGRSHLPRRSKKSVRPLLYISGILVTLSSWSCGLDTIGSLEVIADSLDLHTAKMQCVTQVASGPVSEPWRQLCSLTRHDTIGFVGVESNDRMVYVAVRWPEPSADAWISFATTVTSLENRYGSGQNACTSSDGAVKWDLPGITLSDSSSPTGRA